MAKTAAEVCGGKQVKRRRIANFVGEKSADGLGSAAVCAKARREYGTHPPLHEFCQCCRYKCNRFLTEDTEDAERSEILLGMVMSSTWIRESLILEQEFLYVN
jgi:hypothetical protein